MIGLLLYIIVSILVIVLDAFGNKCSDVVARGRRYVGIFWAYLTVCLVLFCLVKLGFLLMNGFFMVLTGPVCFIVFLFIEMAIDYSYNGDVPDTITKLLQVVWVIVILFAAIAATSALVGLWEVISG